MKTTLILIRHGQSEANLQDILCGQSDYPLTDLGRQQAQIAAKALEHTPIDVFYASDLSRAFETATIVAESHGLPVHPDTGLREMCVGKCEATAFATLKEKYATAYRIWCEDIGHACFPGGETPQQVANRAKETVCRLARRHPGKTVCIGTHAMYIRCLCTLLAGLPMESLGAYPFAANASLTYLSFENGHLHLDAYGVSDHLGDLKTELVYT